ncbi:DUF3987 domain-containing protein [Saccharothrix sp. 6-C]|uniref:DUF3987 domain-containing protein n=1 Tax=Saccharothrix sp. 6-C TaxID=2781735 RepID=UPI0019173B0F|nr:DUF3987 domain-containing protein [Saccharothrix sp. 6-C]QQQ81025.1 DUF3987 domain-containing protein [Saccharothrix sp. 6-C]
MPTAAPDTSALDHGRTAVVAGGQGDVTTPGAAPGDYSTTAGTGRGNGSAPPSGFSVVEVAELDRLHAAAADQVARARQWLPVVDPAAFACYLGNLAQRIDPHTEGDPVGVLATLVGAAGVHLGPNPHVQLGFGERHPLLIWPILIGATGIGRKGTATNAALALFGAADPYFRAENVHSGLSSGEGLAAAFATDDGDTTGEAAGKSGKSPRLLPEGDCRLLALETEWASVMARMKREGNTLGALLRQAWEGGNLSTLNVQARMAARSHLGIVAHITPKEFSAKVSAADLAGGTYNRFLPVAVAQSKHFPTDPDPALMEELAASLSARLTRAGGFDALGFTPAAHVAWQRLQVEFNGHLGADGPVEEFISRAAANCVRIAALYAALDRTDHITPDHMTAAAALVRYSIDSARAIVGNATNSKLNALAKFIADAGPIGRTKKEITTDHFKNKGSADDRDALLAQLANDGRVIVTQRPRADGRTSGRTAEVYLAVNA